MDFESAMQYAFPQGHYGYQHFPGPRQPHQYFYLPPPPLPPPPPPPPPTNFFHPHNHGYHLPYNPQDSHSSSSSYQPSDPPDSQNYFHNAFPGFSVNSGGNWYSGNGFQNNPDINLGYGSHGNINNGEMKRIKRKSTVIGGCHNNQGGHQVSGDVILGDFH